MERCLAILFLYIVSRYWLKSLNNRKFKIFIILSLQEDFNKLITHPRRIRHESTVSNILDLYLRFFFSVKNLQLKEGMSKSRDRLARSLKGNVIRFTRIRMTTWPSKLRFLTSGIFVWLVANWKTNTWYWFNKVTFLYLNL